MKVEVSGIVLDHSNCDSICILDTTTYLDNVDSKSHILRVALPNWSKYHSMAFVKEGVTVLKPSTFEGHHSLPSGVYTFKQSIAPTSKTEVTWYYLHRCSELNQIACIADNQDLCSDTGKKELSKLVDLKLQLDIAGQLVSDGCVNKGIELFNLTKKSLDRLKNNNNCEFCE